MLTESTQQALATKSQRAQTRAAGIIYAVDLAAVLVFGFGFGWL